MHFYWKIINCGGNCTGWIGGVYVVWYQFMSHLTIQLFPSCRAKYACTISLFIVIYFSNLIIEIKILKLPLSNLFLNRFRSFMKRLQVVSLVPSWTWLHFVFLHVSKPNWTSCQWLLNCFDISLSKPQEKIELEYFQNHYNSVHYNLQKCAFQIPIFTSDSIQHFESEMPHLNVVESKEKKYW